MPRTFDLDDVVALLESGTNVVTTRGELFGGGHRLGDERRARVLDACARGSTSIYATGSSPGFITDALPFALLSLQRRVESIEIDEFAEPVAARFAAHAVRADGVRASRSSRTTRRRVRVPARRVRARARRARRGRRPAGRRVDVRRARSRRRAQTTHVAAGELRGRHGRRAADDDRRDAATAPTSCGSPRTGTAPTDVEPAWDLRPTGWRVRVRGDAPFDVDLAVPGPARGLGVVHARVHREPAGERGPVRVRGATRHPRDADLPPITPAGPRHSTAGADDNGRRS